MIAPLELDVARAARSGQIEARTFVLRLSRPIVTARGRIEERVGFEVRIRDGVRVGLGEATILPELGTETFAECEAALRSGRLEGTRAARHGVEQALLDLEAQRRGVPLARLFEPSAPLQVPVSALLTALGAKELAREAQDAAEAGFGTVKLKVGHGALEDDYARACVVRDAVGPRVLLRLDANGAWTPEEALTALRKLAPLGIELCEQPVAPGRLLELRGLLRGELRGLLRGEGREELRIAGVPIAADESMATEPEVALHCAEFIVLKPMLLGGLRTALLWARRAQVLGRKVVVTSSLDGAIARAGAAHLAAALQCYGPQPAAGLATGGFFAGLLDPLAPRNGTITLPDVPGLGLRVGSSGLPESARGSTPILVTAPRLR